VTKVTWLAIGIALRSFALDKSDTRTSRECPLLGVKDMALASLLMPKRTCAVPCVDSQRTKISPTLCRAMRVAGAPVEIAHNIIPLEYANAVRDYARGNLDEAELWAELTALGYDAFEIEWHIANPGQRME
jgi:hypothetical protein